MKPSAPIKLYRHALSGHSHRVELFAALLGLPLDLIDVDLAAGAHKEPKFLARSPFGQVPAIEDGDVVLADSNAILVYLAKRYGAGLNWLPEAPLDAARVQKWLSVASGQLASGPAAARLVNVFGATLDHERAKQIANGLYQVLERELANAEFLIGAQPTIADVAMYSYTAHAPEGDVSLASYPNIREWLGRIEALAGFVPMQKTAIGLAA